MHACTSINTVVLPPRHETSLLILVYINGHMYVHVHVYTYMHAHVHVDGCSIPLISEGGPDSKVPFTWVCCFLLNYSLEVMGLPHNNVHLYARTLCGVHVHVYHAFMEIGSL